MLVQSFELGIQAIINVVLLGLAVFAFVDAAFRREDAYRATDKQTKQLWLILLGVTVAVNLFVAFFLLQIIGLIATIVYLVDVRPAVKKVMGGGPRRSSSDGPYGPHNGGR